MTPRWLVWVLAGLALLVMVDVMAAVAWLTLRPRPAPVVYAPNAHPTSPWRGTSSPHFEETEETTTTRKLPAIKRNVPVFEVRLLDGCSKTDLDTVEVRIQDAINVGAPLYNEGDFGGCYRTYDTAAESIGRTTEKTCKGPAGILKTGRERAAKLSTSAAQAWAMRDAFDGLLDVIDRKGPEL
jgi:hypothetical protein